MMLPSGNDAAQSMAVYVGNYLLQKEDKNRTERIDGNINEDDYIDEQELQDSEEEKVSGDNEKSGEK